MLKKLVAFFMWNESNPIYLLWTKCRIRQNKNGM